MNESLPDCITSIKQNQSLINTSNKNESWFHSRGQKISAGSVAQSEYGPVLLKRQYEMGADYWYFSQGLYLRQSYPI
jgi:hypothetical protein